MPLTTLPRIQPADRPLRIAVIGGRGVPSSYSGVERICEELFAYFASRGHKITQYCRPSVLSEKTGTYRGMRLVRTPAPGGKNGETLTHSLASILHAVTMGDENGESFDLISLHTIAPNLFAPIAAAAGIPVISHVHGLDHQREKWRGLGARVIRTAEKAMLNCASQLVVVNPGLVDYYRDACGRSSALLPNGIYPVNDDFAPDLAVLKSFELSQKDYVVSVGRLVPEKRVHDTIDGFLRSNVKQKLVLVGEGKYNREYEAKLKAQAAGSGRVVFTGQQSGDALETLFRSAAAYVSASELEGMPSSVLECMERRVPAILTDIDAHRAIFGGMARYDLSFNVGDVVTLCHHLQRVLGDAAFAAGIGNDQRQHVRTHYAWPVLAAKTEALYRRVAGEVEVEEPIPQAA
jgi:glycosyltransferase involved in cell wall biosynthesis